MLKEKLKEAEEKLHRLIIGAEKLDRMIEMGKPNGDKTGIGFKPSSSTNSVTKFVKPIINSNSVASDIASKIMNAIVLHDNVMTSFVPKRFNQVCHGCGEIGHIRPRCQNRVKKFSKFTAENLQNQISELAKEVSRLSTLMQSGTMKQKWIWKKKEQAGSRKEKVQENLLCSLAITSNIDETNVVCMVAFTALSACLKDKWYFDSGCSRHMTGDKN